MSETFKLSPTHQRMADEFFAQVKIMRDCKDHNFVYDKTRKQYFCSKCRAWDNGVRTKGR